MEENDLLRAYSLAYLLRIVRIEAKLLSAGKGILVVQELLRTVLAVDEELLRMETTRPWLMDDFYSTAQQALPLVRKSLYYIDLLRETAYLDKQAHYSLHREGSALANRLLDLIRTIERKMRQLEQKPPCLPQGGADEAETTEQTP